jgi:hypothetical protein
MDTDIETQLVQNLITAAWPLPLQIVFGIALVGSYWRWSRHSYWRIDPVLRRILGRWVGATIVWVQRGSSRYPSPFPVEPSTFWQWSWGIAEPSKRTVIRDGLVLLLMVLWVMISAGAWPLPLLLVAFLGLKALSYVVFLPTILAFLVIYGIYWSGRYQLPHMQTE